VKDKVIAKEVPPAESDENISNEPINEDTLTSEYQKTTFHFKLVYNMLYISHSEEGKIHKSGLRT
jgi:hypothetical protein